MKFLSAIISVAFVLASAPIALAGAIVHEEQVVDQGSGAAVTHNRTLMIQGGKQKSTLEGGNQSVITDLDAGTISVINPERKSYFQMPFPPKGSMGGNEAPVTFKKTGKQETVAGNKCSEYSGSGDMAGNPVTINGCFSSSAPGAGDFDEFQSKLAQKAKGTPIAAMSEMPKGVPLKLDTSTKMTHFSLPSMTPEQSAKVREMLAKRPPVVTHTTVTSIETKSLPPETFAVPAGYTKEQMPMRGMPGSAASGPPSSGGAGSGGSSSSKVPE